MGKWFSTKSRNLLNLSNVLTVYKIIGLGLVLMIFYKPAFAQNNSITQVSRYQTVSNKPQSGQLNLLSQIIQVRFPSHVRTIGDALNYLLRLSGYSLVADNKMNKAFKITLTKPLPAIERDFGPMPLKEGLLTLAGSGFYIEDNPIDRTVNFKIKPAFIKFSEG